MKITRESLFKSLVLLEESNHIVYATLDAAISSGLEPEEIEVLPFTLDESHTIAMDTKLAYDILKEMAESL